MRQKFRLKPLLCCAVLVSVISCKKQENAFSNKKDAGVRFAQTEKEKERVTVLKEVGDILKFVYRKPGARFEVNAAIKTEYYDDERVLLKDLLFPDNSPIYRSEKFTKTGAVKGTFKKYFFETLNSGDYAELKAAMGLNSSKTRLTTASPGVDSTNEIWTDEYGVSIYFPYSENFPLINPNDPNNNTANGDLVTIVSADREADSGPGWEAYYSEPDPNGFMCPDNICYRQVTVDDDYAEFRPTHIIGVGAEPAIMRDPPPPATNVNRVYHGWSIMADQKDNFISFTGNGGGSEMKIARISGYLQFQNQQVTSFTGDLVSRSFKRGDIKHKRWKRVYTVWDPDWVPDNLQQVYAVWEEDNEGTNTFTGSLSTTLSLGNNQTGTGTIGYSIQVKTQDELITQRQITRTAYFGDAKTEQGWGFQLCDDISCRYDDTFLPTGQHWPIYDGGSTWRFTWPYNSY